MGTALWLMEPLLLHKSTQADTKKATAALLRERLAFKHAHGITT